MENCRHLDRIPAEETETFKKVYIRNRQPVILTDFLPGQPIRSLATEAELKRIIGAELIDIKQNYARSALDNIRALHEGKPGLKSKKRQVSVSDYVDMTKTDPNTPWLATECPCPSSLLRLIDLRSFGVENIEPGYGDDLLRRETTAHSLMFLANSGNASDLHTDWDGRDVLLFQIMGRKRITLFPPSSAPYLQPIELFGTVRLNGMPEDIRASFIEFAEGWDDVLHPGETAFIPAFYWHHLEYIDLGLSLNFRLNGLDDPNVTFILRNGHANRHIQGVLVAALDQTNQSKRAAAQSLLPVIKDALIKEYKSARQKYEGISAAYALAYEQLYPEGAQHDSLTWIDCNTFLNGVLCARYTTAATTVTGLGRWTWLASQISRNALRSLAYKAANYM